MDSSANLLSVDSPSSPRMRWAPPEPVYARGPRFSQASSHSSLVRLSSYVVVVDCVSSNTTVVDFYGQCSASCDLAKGTFTTSPARTTQCFIVSQYVLPMDPRVLNVPEDDDYLHDPGPRRKHIDDSGNIFTARGLANLGCLFVLVASIVALLYVNPISFASMKFPSILLLLVLAIQSWRTSCATSSPTQGGST